MDPAVRKARGMPDLCDESAVLLHVAVDTAFVDSTYEAAHYYYAHNESNKWIQGKTKSPHLSILTGIDTRSYKAKYTNYEQVFSHDVIDILHSVDPEDTLYTATYCIKEIRVFQNETPGEDPYDCVVGIVDIKDNDVIHKLRKALSATFTYSTPFPDFTPHVTLAYVKEGLGAMLQEKFENEPYMEVTVTACHASFEFSPYPLAPITPGTRIRRYIGRCFFLFCILLLFLITCLSFILGFISMESYEQDF